jgi:hypothetical protein
VINAFIGHTTGVFNSGDNAPAPSITLWMTGLGDQLETVFKPRVSSWSLHCKAKDHDFQVFDGLWELRITFFASVVGRIVIVENG